MAKLPYKIDGVDFTDYVHKYGYAVAYERIHGENDFIYLNGNEEEDILQIKPIVTVTLNDLPDAQLTAFLAAHCKPMVSLTYYDPRTGETLTRSALPTVSQNSVLLDDGAGHWWHGTTVSLRVNLNA